jgi:prepilin-type N-terminal cleavage/methylation domain-containing protein
MTNAKLGTRNAERKSVRRGFSLVEVLVALAICATMLTAAMTALDTSFKCYKVTTEGASTNIVARMVMARIMTMVRTGSQFGPYPVDPLDTAQNPVSSHYVEFVLVDDPVTLIKNVVRIERRAQTDPINGPFELWYVQTDYANGVQTAINERPLITGVLEANFTLEYDVGQNLKRATVDLTVKPNNFQAAFIGGDLNAASIRLVSSVNPRRLVEAP